MPLVKYEQNHAQNQIPDDTNDTNETLRGIKGEHMSKNGTLNPDPDCLNAIKQSNCHLIDTILIEDIKRESTENSQRDKKPLLYAFFQFRI